MFRSIFFNLLSVPSLFVCALSLTFVQLIFFFTVRKINLRFYNKISCYFNFCYGGFIAFFIDWFCNTELYLYINKDDFIKHVGKEKIYLITNHRSEVDIIFLVSLTQKLGVLGQSRYFSKEILNYVPGVGLHLTMNDFPVLTRDFEKDKNHIKSKMEIIMNQEENTLMAIAPEGTRYTREKHVASIQYAKENGLPILKHHLLPRMKGFLLSLPSMRGKNVAIYSVTWAYEPKEPRLMDSVFNGKKIVGHCHMERIPLSEVPLDDKGASEFLLNVFKHKDELLDRFFETGDFRDENEKETVGKRQLKSHITLWIGMFWHLLTLGIILYALAHLALNGYFITLSIFLSIYACLIALGFKVISYMTMKKASSYGLQNNNKDK